jgi:hypothetical protein
VVAWREVSRAKSLRGCVVVGVVTSTVWLVCQWPGQGAFADSTYDAFARANALDVVINNQSIPTGIDLQGVGPEAEAHQTSLGVGDASSQLPYLGDTVPGLPGTAGGLFGLPVPPYPFIAASTQGGPPDTKSYPGVTLHAESGDYSTLSSGVAGSDASGATSTARVDELKSGSVTATAVTDASALKLGSVITLSGVRTSAIVTADSFSGDVTRASSTSIGRISVPGLVLTIPTQTPGQIPVPIPIPGVPNVPPIPVPSVPIPAPFGGQTLKDPDIGIQDGFFTLTLPIGGGSQKFAIPAQPVLAALKAAGVTMTFQAPEKLKTGIMSGSYKFRYVVAAPPANNYYSGPTTVTQSTGLAVATVDLHPASSDTSSSGGMVGGGISGPSSAAGSAGSPSLGSTSPALSGGDLGGANSGTLPLLASPDNGAGTSPGSPALGFAGFKVGTGMGAIYLALVAVALSGFTAATALRLIGVRFLWNS